MSPRGRVTYWCDLLWQPVLLSSVLAVVYRVYLWDSLQAIKRHLAKLDLAGKNHAVVARFKQLTQRDSFQYMLLLFSGLMILPFLTVAIAYGAYPSAFVASNTNCLEDFRIDIIQLLFFVGYAGALFLGLFTIRRKSSSPIAIIIGSLIRAHKYTHHRCQRCLRDNSSLSPFCWILCAVVVGVSRVETWRRCRI